MDKIFLSSIVALSIVPMYAEAKCGFVSPCKVITVTANKCTPGTLMATIESMKGADCIYENKISDIEGDSLGSIRQFTFPAKKYTCEQLMASKKLWIRMAEDWCEWGEKDPEGTQYASVMSAR